MLRAKSFLVVKRGRVDGSSALLPFSAFGYHGGKNERRRSILSLSRYIRLPIFRSFGFRHLYRVFLVSSI